MESSYNAEKSHSEGENSPESCLINTLRDDISGKVVINEGTTMNYMNDVQHDPAEGHYTEEYQDEEEDEDDEEDGDDFSEEELLAQMGYGKSEPNSVMKKEKRKQDSDDDEDNKEDDNLLEESLLAQMGYTKNDPPKHEPISTPTAARNLVSALKGSRDKEGKPARECRVSWAPDMYDPPPSTEHFATPNIQSRKSELKAKGLAGKNRQKMGGKGAGGLEEGVGGGGSQGSKVGGNKGSVGVGGKTGMKHKDRKQVKKKGGGSASKYSNLDDC